MENNFIVLIMNEHGKFEQREFGTITGTVSNKENTENLIQKIILEGNTPPHKIKVFQAVSVDFNVEVKVTIKL